MNNKIKAIGIISVILAVAVAPMIAAQQENDYRAFLVYQYVDTGHMNVTNVTMNTQIVYVPVYPSPTYTLTYQYKLINIDVAKPATIDEQVAADVKAEGQARGYNIIKVFIPGYNQKIP